ncbi:hypothetical protein Tco_1428890 [Tanacetum coccineum]
MECLYKEDVERIFTLDEPFEEMGSEAIEVPALKEEEFAQITRHENSPLRGTDIQEKNKKKAKSKQIRARNGKDKVKSQAK